jgi:hypothetical protein
MEKTELPVSNITVRVCTLQYFVSFGDEVRVGERGSILVFRGRAATESL